MTILHRVTALAAALAAAVAPWSPALRESAGEARAEAPPSAQAPVPSAPEPAEAPPSVSEPVLLALFPLENLSGAPAPLVESEVLYAEALGRRGVRLLDAGATEAFLARHLVRWTGGVAEGLGRTLASETGASGILVTSIDLDETVDPPRSAVTSRLVSTDEGARILWMDSVVVAGDDAPGLLDLGTVHDPEAVRGAAIDRLAGSLEAFLEDARRRQEKDVPRRFRPKSFYRDESDRSAAGSTDARRSGAQRIAVLPFRNDSLRISAGDLMALQFVRALDAVPGVEVIEPGVVRQALLQGRVIQEGGLSLAQSDTVRDLLGASLVVTGTVTEYEDVAGPWGVPRVAMSARAFDTAGRRVLWVSTSHNTGMDGVVFFDLGRVRTAHALAEMMVRAVVERSVLPLSGRAPRGEPRMRGAGGATRSHEAARERRSHEAAGATRSNGGRAASAQSPEEVRG